MVLGILLTFSRKGQAFTVYKKCVFTVTKGTGVCQIYFNIFNHLLQAIVQ